AEELAKRWRSSGREGRLPVFLEVNLSGEETKAGVHPDDAPAVAKQLALIEPLEVRGLMAIPAPGSGPAAFPRLREIEQRCRPVTQGDLSMGMTEDFEEALKEG